MSAIATPVASTAASTRLARTLVERLAQIERVRDRVEHRLGGTSASDGCNAAESSMQSASSATANSSHSSMARSGSGSRRSRGVSSCSAAVSTPIGMNFGSNCLISDMADPL